MLAVQQATPWPPLLPCSELPLAVDATPPCCRAAAAHQPAGSAAAAPSCAGGRRLASLRHLSLQYFTAAQVASSDHLARRFIGRWHCWQVCGVHVEHITLSRRECDKVVWTPEIGMSRVLLHDCCGTWEEDVA